MAHRIPTAVMAAVVNKGPFTKPADRLRRVLARRHLIAETEIAGRRMLVPLEHDLPVILSNHPEYAANLVRLTVAANGPMIDVGANIGDSIALIRQSADVPCLAVEGDPIYLPLLRANVASMTDVDIEASYVESDLSLGTLAAERRTGTAALVPSSTGQALPLRSFVEIVTDNPRFARPRLVKIDTDGADAAIIASNADWFADAQPIVFFEYDALCAARLGDKEPWRAFTSLADAGYSKAAVYVNTGEFLIDGDAGDTGLWRDLARYCADPSRAVYFDVAVFPATNIALAEQFLAAERARAD